MRTRTRLTTPPGDDPVPERAGGTMAERHSPGLAMPREPRVPGRHRTLLLTAATLAALAAFALVWFQLATRGQGEDPSLAPPIDGSDAPAGGQPTVDPAG